MIQVTRSEHNPILKPEPADPWQNKGAFNGSVVYNGEKYFMVYRALSDEQLIDGVRLQLSTIGLAESDDGANFKNHRQIITPTEEWEKFGCEDPRITILDDTFYIFYTALSEFPFNANGIKVAVAVTQDLYKKPKKHLVTPFNAKAMTLFPQLVNGQLAAILTVNTDNPPARICLALFDDAQQLWSKSFWEEWHKNLEDHVLFVKRNLHDHVEVGAPPIKTKVGWLAVFSYIQNYFAPPPTFGVEAVLLDLKNPLKIIGRTVEPIFSPETDYEKQGNVSNIAFPTGAVAHKNELSIYYGAADTTTCLATVDLRALLKIMLENGPSTVRLRRYSHNPIIEPIKDHDWERKATFNPAAWYDGERVHLLYRAQSEDNTSVFGYASTVDGFHIDERLNEPVYIPREDFEQKLVPGGNSGCEDPRLTQVGDALYLCYTAYNGTNPPRVALSTISVKDFKNHNWNWSKAELISPPGQDDKDAALFPEKINGQYAILHRLGSGICLDFSSNLEFGDSHWLDGNHIMQPRDGAWDSVRIGIAAPPIKTKNGWLLLYHGISHHAQYRLGAALLDLKDPTQVLAQTDEPILEPELSYEKYGQVPRVVFPCGAVVIDGDLIVYYGAADTVIGVAHLELKEILE